MLTMPRRTCKKPTIYKKTCGFKVLLKIKRNFIAKNIGKFIQNLNILFKKIPHTLAERNERYFHSLFYLVLKILGFKIETEILTIDGRIDAVVKTDDNIYIIEFKIDQSSEIAIQQIKNKKCAFKYVDDKLPIDLLGINFNTDKKEIEDYLAKFYFEVLREI